MVSHKRTTSDLAEKLFPNLEELRADAKHIATNNSLFPEDLLCKLKCLEAEFGDESTTIFSLDDFLRRFHTIKVLCIGGGSYGWEAKETVENGMTVIVREVNKCYDLKHFLKQESPIADNLEQLKISECSHLINLVPSSSSFQNLTTLVVSYCKELKNVLTSSAAKTLVRLREMKISGCNMITEIVADDDDAAKDEIIVFNELKKLTLSYLKSLTSFCSGSCAIKFPYLEILVVDDCHNMMIFSRGELSAPMLHKVQLKTWDRERWAWEDDLNKTIQQVNLKRESFIKKRRDDLQSQRFLPSAPRPSLNLQTKLEILPAMVAGVWSDDNSLQLEATTQFRILLSIERSPRIEDVIQAGVVPRFVEFLMREDYPQLQYEAAWALTNIASGTSMNTNVVIDHGAVPIFVKLLASPSDDVREQAVWALGNVAADSPGCRNLVLREEALIPLLAQLNEHAKLSMLRIATWTLSKLCKGKPQPPFDQVRPALPALAQLIHLDDEEVLSDACWTLSYLSYGTNDKIQVVIEAGVCRRLVELLGHPSPSVLTPALWTVGNIVMGDDFQTQCIINHGAVPCLLALLIHNHKKSIKKVACWTISNITAGNREQIQAVIDAGLIVPLVNVLQDAEFDIKKEAALAIANATVRGTHEQIKYLVREGCIKPLCDLLLCVDPKIVTVCLEGLENILKVGEAEKNTGSTIGDVNQYARLVEEDEGFKKIEGLKSHDNNGIREKAVKILETYWCGRVVGPQLGLC
ncbi:Importin subunit alpha-2 [Citrus sinensis]|uniref:Importin subunit alpha-2 n=3 Tax=Citrus TaxID=2706 RepID=A0ACB8KIG1_CITSI|nr:Importin subunit alpha-2 [Citrus sinensis]